MADYTDSESSDDDSDDSADSESSDDDSDDSADSYNTLDTAIKEDNLSLFIQNKKWDDDGITWADDDFESAYVRDPWYREFIPAPKIAKYILRESIETREIAHPDEFLFPTSFSQLELVYEAVGRLVVYKYDDILRKFTNRMARFAVTHGLIAPRDYENKIERVYQEVWAVWEFCGERVNENIGREIISYL